MIQPLNAGASDIRSNLIYRLTTDVPFQFRLYEDDPGPIIYDGINQPEKVIFPKGTEVKALFCGPHQFKSHGVFSVIQGGRIYTTWINFRHLEHVEGYEGLPIDDVRYFEDGHGNYRQIQRDVTSFHLPYVIDRESLDRFVSAIQKLPVDLEVGIDIGMVASGYNFHVYELKANDDEDE